LFVLLVVGDDQFGFRPMFSAAVELASRLEKFNRYVDNSIPVCDNIIQQIVARKPPLQVQCP